MEHHSLPTDTSVVRSWSPFTGFLKMYLSFHEILTLYLASLPSVKATLVYQFVIDTKRKELGVYKVTSKERVEMMNKTFLAQFHGNKRLFWINRNESHWIIGTDGTPEAIADSSKHQVRYWGIACSSLEPVKLTFWKHIGRFMFLPSLCSAVLCVPPLKMRVWISGYFSREMSRKGRLLLACRQAYWRDESRGITTRKRRSHQLLEQRSSIAFRTVCWWTHIIVSPPYRQSIFPIKTDKISRRLLLRYDVVYFWIHHGLLVVNVECGWYQSGYDTLVRKWIFLEIQVRQKLTCFWPLVCRLSHTSNHR